MVVLGVAGLAAMWGDVSDSHAAAAHSLSVLKMVEQWLHFVSAGVWIGGLLVLLIGLVGLAAAERGHVARRYSSLALASVVVLAASGTLRAIDEVGSWDALVSTGFGRLILVKTGLLAVLVGLGARNRYRSVPEVEGSPRPLLRLGRAELGLAAVVLVATAVLQGLAPPATVAAAPAPKPLVVTGHDFATTVKVRLRISPGTTGFNQFDLAADDYDTGRPVVADPVTLTFSQPDRPDVGQSTLTLRRAADGTYQASGPNLSINGTWRVVVLVQQSSGAAQIDLSVTPAPAPRAHHGEPQSGHPRSVHDQPDHRRLGAGVPRSGSSRAQRVPRHLRRRRRSGDAHPFGHGRGHRTVRRRSTDSASASSTSSVTSWLTSRGPPGAPTGSRWMPPSPTAPRPTRR